MAANLGTIGSAFVEVQGNFSALEKDITGVNSKLGKSLKNIGSSMTGLGAKLSLGLTAPLVGFGTMIAKTAGDFEASMKKVEAMTGATGDKLGALEAKARDLGATTQFSAGQAADAMSFLAMAGFNADQVLGSMESTLQLAAAAQLDLGQAADITSNILTGFGMATTDLAKANDVLVATITKSNTDMVQLGEAMKFVAPVASAAGGNFEEVAAAIGLLGNAGIQASMAGTTMRGAFSRLLNPSKEASDILNELGIKVLDSTGKMRPLADLLDDLAPLAERTGDVMTIFGDRAGSGMAALLSQGGQALRDFTKELEQPGIAGDIAAKRMEGFNGAMLTLKSAFQELQLAIAASGLLEFLTDLVKGLAETLRWLAETNPAILKWGTVVAGIAAAGAPALIFLGLLTQSLGTLMATNLGAWGVGIVKSFTGIGAAATATGGNLATLGATAATTGAKAGLLTTAWGGLTTAFSAIVPWITTIGGALLGWPALIAAIVVGVTALVAWFVDWGKVIKSLSWVWEAFGNLVTAIWDRISYTIANAGQIISGIFNWIKTSSGPVATALRPIFVILEAIGYVITEKLVGAFNWLATAVQSLANWISPLTDEQKRFREELNLTTFEFGKAKTAMEGHANALKGAIESGQVVGAVMGDVTAGVADAGAAADKATGQVDDLGGGLDNLGGGLDTAGDKAADFAEKLEASLHPANSLEIELASLLTQFSKEDIVKVYGTRILEAAAAHKRLNGRDSLPATVAELEKLAKVMDAANKAIEEQNRIMDPWLHMVKDSGMLLERYNRQQKGHSITVDGVTHSYDGWSDSVLALGESLQIASGKIDITKSTLGDMKVEIDDTSDVLAASERSIESWARKQKESVEQASEFAKNWQQAWNTAIGNTVGKWIDGLGEMRFSFSEWGGDILDMLSDLGKTMLKMFVSEIFKPILGAANRFGQNLAQTIGSALFGGQGPSGGLFGGIFDMFTGGGKGGGLLGGLFDRGPSPIQVASSTVLSPGGAAGPVSLAGMLDLPLMEGPLGLPTGGGGAGGFLGNYSQLFGSKGIMGFLGPGLLGAGVGGLIGDELGSAIGGGLMTALAPFLPALFSNPITAAIGAGLLGGKILFDKFIKKDAFKSGIKEIQRDFGVAVQKGTLDGFVAGLGLSKKQFEPFRKSITGSPKAFEDILLTAAKAQGKVEELIAAYGKFSVSPAFAEILRGSGLSYTEGGGGFLVDLSDAARQAAEGNFAALNEAFLKLFGESGLADSFGDLSRFLSTTVTGAADNLADSSTALADENRRTREAVERTATRLDELAEGAGTLGRPIRDLADRLRETEGTNEEMRDALAEAAGRLTQLSEDADGLGGPFERLAQSLRDLARRTDEQMQGRPDVDRPGGGRGGRGGGGAGSMFGGDASQSYVDRLREQYGDLGTPGNRPHIPNMFGFNILDNLDRNFPGWDQPGGGQKAPWVSYQGGGPVPTDGLAFLHGGEFVLSSHMLDLLDNFMGRVGSIFGKLGSFGNLTEKLGGIASQMGALERMGTGPVAEDAFRGIDPERGGRREIHMTNHINTLDARSMRELIQQEMVGMILDEFELRHRERVTTMVENTRAVVGSKN
jgi:TP901 family phage tail tape measure protein